VWGRAPPLAPATRRSVPAPAPPEISQDLLSVINTRGFSVAALKTAAVKSTHAAKETLILHPARSSRKITRVTHDSIICLEPQLRWKVVSQKAGMRLTIANGN